MLILDSVLSLGQTLIDKLIPDPKAKADAFLKLTELQQTGDLAAIAGQIELNKREATQRSIFVAGWRPFVGWVCAVALAAQLVLFPILTFFLQRPMPILNVELLSTLLIGMLGLGGMRTIEKLQGVSK